MMKEYETFGQLQREIRDSFGPMLSVKDVRNIIGCSWGFVIQLIVNGELDAYDITGQTLEKENIDEGSHGIRITPSSLREYIDNTKIK